jgi:ribosome-associated protein
MPRRPAPGSTAPRQADAPFDEDGAPSRTQRKREATDLQKLGSALAALPPARLRQLPMEESLREALLTLQGITAREGGRRQRQLVGKLMRRQPDVTPLQEAVALGRLAPARESLRLHETERWRDALLADDAQLDAFCLAQPGADRQRLRQLVRQARAARAPDLAPGQSQRQDRSFRALFRALSEVLAQSGQVRPASNSPEDDSP